MQWERWTTQSVCLSGISDEYMNKQGTQLLNNMDRIVKLPFWKRPAFFWVMTASVALLFGLFAKFLYDQQQMPVVSHLKIQKSAITLAEFKDILSTRATLEPALSASIDSGVSGRVVKVHVRNGSKVQRGDILVTLTNPELDMQNLQQQSQISDRLNALDSRDLELRKLLVSRRSEIESIKFNQLQSERELENNRHLFDLDIVSRAAVEQSLVSLEYQNERLKLAQENLVLDEELLKDYTDRNAQSRKLAQGQLENLKKQAEGLIIRATIEGTLSGLGLTPGQQISQGTHIG